MTSTVALAWLPLSVTSAFEWRESREATQLSPRFGVADECFNKQLSLDLNSEVFNSLLFEECPPLSKLSQQVNNVTAVSHHYRRTAVLLSYNNSKRSPFPSLLKLPDPRVLDTKMAATVIPTQPTDKRQPKASFSHSQSHSHNLNHNLSQLTTQAHRDAASE